MMDFINRENERNSFKDNYKINIQSKVNQVYIIEANRGVGKTEFIREVSKSFSYYPLEIFRLDNNEELSIFKRMVLELDKISGEYGYDDFKTFYRKKTNNDKAIQLLLKITAIFGQAWAKSKEFEVGLSSLMDNPIRSEKYVLNPQTENLFEYSKYVFTTVQMHVVFHNASIIDCGSLDLLSKLIATTKGNVFVFESNNNETSLKIEKYLQNSHNSFYKKYTLDKLSNVHIQTYIQQLLSDLKLEAKYIDSGILEDSIEKGDLKEISSLLNDFCERLQKDTSTKMRSTKELLQSLSDKQRAILILTSYANGKLNLIELQDIINELYNSFSLSDVDLLLKKGLIEENCNYIFLPSFVCEIFDTKEYIPSIKYAVASALIKNLNTKLSQTYNNRYVDVLVEYYLKHKLFYQLKSLLPQISQRLKDFNTQAERVDYFKKFEKNSYELYRNDKSFAMIFAKMAYDTNLYSEAMCFIDLLNDLDDEIIFMRAIILNRCEKFINSKKYIIEKLRNLDKESSIYFKLSLVLMMNLIQLNERNDAVIIFNEIKTYTQEPLYPYLIRLSNVFYSDYNERLELVESITKIIYETNNSEFSGLHAIYLAYLYALTKQPERAEKSLLKARDFFGKNLIYNHMILHNEATIKFHNNEIDEEIQLLLNNAKITVYDEYDQFAINNNLLVYFILSDKISSMECYNTVIELETMLKCTSFKRFVDKIYYNLYHYYLKTFNYEKSEHYKTKLLQSNVKFDDDYKYKLIYETSWKLPLI